MSWADDFVALIDEALTQHPVVSSRMAGVDGARAAVDQARWAFFPTPEVSVSRQWLPGSDRSSQGEVLSAGLRQPLWTGGSLSASLAQERLRQQISEHLVDEVRQDLGVALVEGYGEWLTAYRKYQAWEENLAMHEELRAQLSNRLATGVSSQSDMALIESRLATVRAEHALYGSQVDIALERVAEIVGREITSAELVSLAVTPQALNRSLSEMLQVARLNHPAVRQAELEIAVSQEERELARAQRFPELSLLAQREMSLSNDFEDANVITLELRSRLGPGLATWSSAERATSLIEASQYERDAVNLEIRERISSDYVLLNTLNARIIAMENAEQGAREVFASYRRQYLAGQKSWLDVINSVGDVVRAQSALIDAEVARVVTSWRLVITATGLDSLSGGRS